MTKSKKEPEDSKVFDVSKPGETKPSASSRPIIVNRTQLVQDPMMKGKDKGEVLGPPTVDEHSEEFKKIIHPTATRISIDPQSEESPKKATPPEKLPKNSEPDDQAGTAENEQDSVSQEQANDSKTEDETQDSDEKTEPEVPKSADNQTDNQAEASDDASDSKQDSENPDKKPDSDTMTNDDNSATIVESPQPDNIVDELAKQAVSKKQKEKEDKQVAEKNQKIKKLIEDKTYFLPVGRATRRKNARRFLLGMILLILVAVVVADLALDAGILKSNIKPITHLFNN